MLDDLMRSKILEYVYVSDFSPENSVVSNLTLTKNIKRLRYFFVHQKSQKCNVILDLNGEFPDDLRCFDVSAFVCRRWNSFYVQKCAAIKGDKPSFARLIGQLVHTPNVVWVPTHLDSRK